MIAGDDGADFVAGRARPRRILDAAGGRDDELVGRQHQFGRTILRERVRLNEQPAPAVVLGFECLLGRHGAQDFPRFGGRHQGGVVSFADLQAKIARAPEVAARRISTAFLDAIEDLFNLNPVHRERRAFAIEQEAQGWQHFLR